MKQVSKDVKMFFDGYEKSGNTPDSEPITSYYDDTFMFAGPQGVQSVKKEDFLKALPKRDGFFKAAGLKGSRIQSLEETRLDDNYLMVKVYWEMRFEKNAGDPVDVDLVTTYMLYQQDAELRIVFQLDHQDFMKIVGELGLLP